MSHLPSLRSEAILEHLAYSTLLRTLVTPRTWPAARQTPSSAGETSATLCTPAACKGPLLHAPMKTRSWPQEVRARGQTALRFCGMRLILTTLLSLKSRFIVDSAIDSLFSHFIQTFMNSHSHSRWLLIGHWFIIQLMYYIADIDTFAQPLIDYSTFCSAIY